ncbi:MAG TPA: endo-1,4-beta-xylanase [Bacillota bacterium]|nr:endo-1,4-beta-xylanase [Bacillota bacterium]
MTSDIRTPSLWQRHRNHFSVGAAVTPATIKTHRELLTQHFNSLTCENHMKPSILQPIEGEYSFEAADAIVDFAKEHSMLIRGHTLVWHNQTPDWFFLDGGLAADKALLLDRLKNHTKTVIDRYGQQIYCWDVVNEAVEDQGDVCLRDSKWLKIVGKDFIKIAFEIAREADPKAKLFYNDYNAVVPKKRDKIFGLLKDLKEKDTPIDGMGIQGHWDIYNFSEDDIRKAIEMYASLGLEIHITELDVSVHDWMEPSSLKKPTAKMIDLQEKKYDEIFTIFREYSEVVKSVTLWGVADDITWLDGFPIRGRKNWPLLFDEDHQPKESFWRVVDF